MRRLLKVLLHVSRREIGWDMSTLTEITCFEGSLGERPDWLLAASEPAVGGWLAERAACCMFRMGWLRMMLRYRGTWVAIGLIGHVGTMGLLVTGLWDLGPMVIWRSCFVRMFALCLVVVLGLWLGGT